MNQMPLVLPPLAADDYLIKRSEWMWHAADGAHIAAYAPAAECRLVLHPRTRRGAAAGPFLAAGEHFLSVTAAAPISGVARRPTDYAAGGFFEFLPGQRANCWSGVEHLLDLELERDGRNGVPREAELLFVASRRILPHPEFSSAWLQRVFDRLRAWWEPPGSPPAPRDASEIGNVVFFGDCDLTWLVEDNCRRLFSAVAGPVHITAIPPGILVPAARSILGQLAQTEGNAEEIAREIRSWLPMGSGTLQNGSGYREEFQFWTYLAALGDRLCGVPVFDENFRVLGTGGVTTLGRPHAVITSLNAEAAPAFRHKRLGFTLPLADFRIHSFPARFKEILRGEFTPVEQSAADVKQAIIELYDALQQRGINNLLVLNMVTNAPDFKVYNYRLLPDARAAALYRVLAKQYNLALYQAARERDFSIIDADAIAAEIGADHVPDGVHYDQIFLEALRTELIRVLNDRRIPGFSPRPSKNA